MSEMAEVLGTLYVMEGCSKVCRTFLFWNFKINCVIIALYNKNKPTCARVAAMTSVAHNKIKQHPFNVKVNFFLVLHHA